MEKIKTNAQKTTKKTIKVIDSIYRTFIGLCLLSGSVALVYCAMKHVEDRNWKIALIVPAAGLFSSFIVEMVRLNSKD